MMPARLISNAFPADFYPGFLTAVGETLFFSANDGTNGNELWKSDGTSAGTVLVRDIRPQGPGSFPGNFTVIGNTLFFTATDGVNGQELWRSDGTSEGTVLVRDIDIGDSGSYPYALEAVGATLFFRASDGVIGSELWKTDGTSGGTVLVRDIRLGNQQGSGPNNLTALGETLFFTANDGLSGSELWKSDGTEPGTVLVRNIVPGSLGSDPSNLAVIGSTLFFRANDRVTGEELWKTDGTSDGTVLVKDIQNVTSGPFFGSSPRYLTGVGSTLFFYANDFVHGRELWKSDGTSAGTVLVKDIRSGGYSSYPSYLTALGETLFFSADDGVNGRELWKTDGTEAGTVLVRDIRPGTEGYGPSNLTAVGDTLYFTANDGTNGTELWRSDGTSAGTVLVQDIRPGGSGSLPSNLTVIGTTLFFRADDGVNGRQLWALDLNASPANPSQLSIAAVAADRSEGNSGSTPFSFSVTRTGSLAGQSTARWAVRGSGATAAAAADFVGGVLPSGTVQFAAGERTKTITVFVAGDTLREADERFAITLSNPSAGTTIGTGQALGIIRNDDLIGTPRNDRLQGSRRPEFLDGRGGPDTLIGGPGPDVFGFRFRESTITAPDRITDFTRGQDRIAVLDRRGRQQPRPRVFTRAADNRDARTLAQLAAAVFADADGKARGTQPLRPKAAALVRSTNRAIRGTYLLINDSKAGLNERDDLMVNLTGLRGALPAFGRINAAAVFV